jgi:hypothetical protein
LKSEEKLKIENIKNIKNKSINRITKENTKSGIKKEKE